ncbi:unnamed protein product [Lactuca virosa]|uniref:Uncharacterized protein n=1 Tax=Lactuca virosa TaxID=75947 RepID=A0AAU9NFH2_9ASTR|nr:unnamed protein product [Lactuca virosa]
MKMACLAVGVEIGKQAIREQVVAVKFVSWEPNVTVEHSQAMYAAVKSFMEIDFASNLHLVSCPRCSGTSGSLVVFPIELRDFARVFPRFLLVDALCPCCAKTCGYAQ